MYSPFEVQSRFLIPRNIYKNLYEDEAKGLKLLVLLVISLIIAILNVFLNSKFLIESCTVLAILTLLISSYYQSRGPSKEYSYGYQRSVCISYVFCWMLLIAGCISNAYLILFNDLLDVSVNFHILLCVASMVQIFFIRPPQIIFMFLLWSILNHFVLPISYLITKYIAAAPSLLILILGTIGISDQIKELMESAPTKIDVNELRENILKVISKQIPDIDSVHDIHVWKIGNSVRMTLHVVSRSRLALKKVFLCCRTSGVDYCTVQHETEDYICMSNFI
jgi:Co/Zn/Cd efflux system component